MSQFKFNISKSSATTSTSNATSTSLPPSLSQITSNNNNNNNNSNNNDGTVTETDTNTNNSNNDNDHFGTEKIDLKNVDPKNTGSPNLPGSISGISGVSSNPVSGVSSVPRISVSGHISAGPANLVSSSDTGARNILEKYDSMERVRELKENMNNSIVEEKTKDSDSASETSDVDEPSEKVFSTDPESTQSKSVQSKELESKESNKFNDSEMKEREFKSTESTEPKTPTALEESKSPESEPIDLGTSKESNEPKESIESGESGESEELENSAESKKPGILEPEIRSSKVSYSSMSMQAYEPELETNEPVKAYEKDSDDDKLSENEIFSEKSDKFEKTDLLSIDTTEPLEEYQVPEINGPESTKASLIQIPTPSNQEPTQNSDHNSTSSTQKSNQKSNLKETRVRSSRKDSLASKVDARQQHQMSHRPFDFSIFLAHLRKKSADPIVRYIRSFLVSFTRKSDTMSTAQKTKAVRNFTEFLAEKFYKHEPFASMDALDTENSLEGVEKLVMNRLYECCFPVSKGNHTNGALAKDIDDDRELSSQMEKFSWLSGVHLDVDVDHLSKDSQVDYLHYAETELNKINSYRAPRDKIICILNACKIIFSLLRANGQETNADSFIPLLILVMLRAKTPYLLCNLHYIERYRGERWLIHGETSYYLSTVQGAISFIQNIQKDDLTVTDKEYEAHMEAWDAVLRQKKAQTQKTRDETASEGVSGDSHAGRTLSPSGVILASAEMLTKSISSFISPASEETETSEPQESTSNPPSAPTDTEIDQVFAQLAEVFPNLDKAIMRDIIVMNDAKLEPSLDMCLQLVE